METGKAVAFILLGLAGLMLGGYWIVEGAVYVSRSLGISESVIGLTIVAVGTSLPELATSVVAARKGNADIAVGNVVGSNIFNIFFYPGDRLDDPPATVFHAQQSGYRRGDIGQPAAVSFHVHRPAKTGRSMGGGAFFVDLQHYIGTLTMTAKG
jgi:hypothetical protein